MDKTPQKFWKKWEKADETEQLRMVSKTYISKELATHMQNRGLNKSYSTRASARTVNEYFVELYAALLQK